MGNAESQSLEPSGSVGDKSGGSLGRKHTSRSLRLSGKVRRSRHASSGKLPARGSDGGPRCSSTPSIPQALAENGLQPFAPDGPTWVDMGLRPVSYHTDSSVTPSVDSSTALTAASTQSMPGSEEGRLSGDEAAFLVGLTSARRPFAPRGGAAGFKKKRSKSADIWREDSLEFSLSDLSQEHFTSNEEILGPPGLAGMAPEAGGVDGREPRGPAATEAPTPSPGSCPRTNSLDDLYAPDAPGQAAPTGRRTLGRRTPDRTSRRMAGGDCPQFSASNTLPCRKSHCLSEGTVQLPFGHGWTMQGRRSKTAQDVNAGEGGEPSTDSGIEATATDSELPTCLSPAPRAGYSPPAGRAPAGSDSGSSSAGDAARQGVYENFRRELQLSVAADGDGGGGGLEEAGSAHSDEQSSDTLSSPARSDILSGGSGAAAGQGTVRKAGALAVKNFLVHKKSKKVESATRRKWKQYWVSLKGCTLFFYESDGRSGIDPTSAPKHAVWVENSIVQAVPEHPKKDFVFCLSNSLGDAFLFQTSSQTELENWVTAIHSACAAAVARQHHKEDTLRLLRSEIKKLEQKIDMDEKMKKMGEMQVSSVTDSKKKKTILDQILVWEQNLEQFQMDLFRFRCYLASLQGGELPNPKRLLAFAGRTTKVAMGRLGIFSVSSFHALVAARTGEAGVRRRTQAMSRSASKRRSRFSSLWGLDTTSKKKQPRPSINEVFGEGMDPTGKSLEGLFIDDTPEGQREPEAELESAAPHNPDCDIWVHEYFSPSWYCLPSNQVALTVVRPGDTAMDMLDLICKAHLLDPSAHYLQLVFLTEGQPHRYIPDPEEDIYELLYKEIEICPKITRSLQLEKSDSSADNYGFSLAAMEEDGSRRLYVTSVKDTGLAADKGVRAGDEILEVNRRAAPTLTPPLLKDFLSQPLLSLTVRGRPGPGAGPGPGDPPPHRGDGPAECSQSPPRGLLGGAPDPGLCCERGGSGSETPVDHSPDTPDTAGSGGEADPAGQETPGPPPAAARQLSDADKLRKVICEVLETERTYVTDLNCLMDRYLKPLQKETFLTPDELDVLFGNLVEMVDFQVEFLKTLEDGVRLVPNLDQLERVDQFKKVLFSLGGSFLYYADRFKLYSAFCASHTKVPKVLVKAKSDAAFKAFLDAQNPRQQQHSSTLESYLIKPIQRVLKYPLLLRELFALTDADSEEHYHLDVAIKTMNKVASHINEMQKLHEEFGAVFDQLIAEQTGEKKEVADLSMGDLLLHTAAVWINPPASLGKWKKEPELAAFVFKTAVVLVYKDGAKQKKKLGGSHRLSIYEDWDPFRFRHMVPTDALQIRALATTDADTSSVCEIVHVKSESEGRPERAFHLCCSSPESKKEFLKAVRSALRDQQRRQLLQTESLPAAQLYMPFGGKRLSALKGARPAMSRAVSAPSKSLVRRRRRLARNRFTIDADDVAADSPDREPRPPPAAASRDTDRWVEEQLDLAEQLDDQLGLKETDILSDEDDSGQAGGDGEPQDRSRASSITAGGPRGQGAATGHAARLAQLRKQAALSGPAVGPEEPREEAVWVRRQDFVPSRKLNTEI
ncbi:T-lymphoma invasion and metastasis-inducing protein 1 [Tachyglossus aculeatus]|uniref:T-lymphoma invasion and metastasis-inducing protein 1 n=1 Tax=Tachyglossus aculeatus TaxID=9261 RepID=UPI0018F4C56A|nr:T-lymphoma invasion and metastasis-inducing protein 1 [Tachyglossus aculeatus]